MKTLGVVVLLAACGDNGTPPPSGPHFRYVVSELHIPSTNAETKQFGLDLNGDGVVDNQLGTVFSLLASYGLSVAETASDALLRGGLIMLADLQTTGFDDAPAASFTTYLGSDPSPAPCEDPERLETCGRHLTGTGTFSVVAFSGSDSAIAPIADAAFAGGGEIMPIELALDDGSPPIRLDLRPARVQLTAISDAHVSAVIDGAITTDDVSAVVIPQAQAQIDRIVHTECGQPSGVPPCGCPAGSRSELLRGVFDTNQDCRVSIDEVAMSSLVKSLLYPDVTFGTEHGLSFGLGVELVPAKFEP